MGFNSCAYREQVPEAVYDCLVSSRLPRYFCLATEEILARIFKMAGSQNGQ